MGLINLNEIKPFINRDRLLSEISDENIYRYYIKDFQIGKVMNSPLRKDKNPSFGVYYYKGTLFYKDFGLLDSGSGDCIHFVAKLFNIPYTLAISQIALDFGLESKYSLDPNIKKSEIIGVLNKSTEKTYKHKPKIIEVSIRSWNSKDLKFWMQFNISKQILNFYNVFPIDFLFINDDILSVDKYAYAFKEDKDNIVSYKIYQPYSKIKWISNQDKTVHQGYTQLPETGKLLIITKSRKDVMSFCSVGIPAIGIQSETVLIKKEVMVEYNNRFDKVVCLFDNDTAGITLSYRYKTMYNVPFILIPYKYGCKDFSDLIKKIGAEKAIKIIKNCLKNI